MHQVYLIQGLQKKVLVANDGTKWQYDSPKKVKTSSQNILRQKEGPSGKAACASTPAEIFSCLISDKILSDVVLYTNTYAKSYYLKSPDSWSLLSLNELKGVIGILYLFGIYRGQRQPIRELLVYQYFEQRLESIALNKFCECCVLMIGLFDLLVFEINLHHFVCFGIHSTIAHKISS